MCKYKNLKKAYNFDFCTYPHFYTEHIGKLRTDLPIDDDGFCLFHSKNDKWKIENNFIGNFLELVDIVGNLNSNQLGRWVYNFSGFRFPNYEVTNFEAINFRNGTVDFSHATFNAEVNFSNLSIEFLDTTNSTFNQKLSFKNVHFSKGIISDNATFENGLLFLECNISSSSFFYDCIFNNKSESKRVEIAFKTGSNINNLNFEGSIMKTRVAVWNSSINGEFNFDKCIIEDEFIFHENQVNNIVKFVETEFTLKSSPHTIISAVSFGNNILSEKGKFIFKGKSSKEDMVQSEFSMYFNENQKPKGLISFENFNFNRVYNKEKLLELRQDNIVEILSGCQIYYLKTEIFTFTPSAEASLNLIAEMAVRFRNYFESDDNFNLGLEIVEKSKTTIKYFYYTNTEISQEDFFKKIKETELNIWRDFKKFVNGEYDVRTGDLNLELIEYSFSIAKFGLYLRNNIIPESDLSLILSAYSSKLINMIEKSGETVFIITQGKSNISSDCDEMSIIKNLTLSFEGSTKVINAENYIEKK